MKLELRSLLAPHAV